MALGGAIGSSGANQAAMIRANEAQLQEQRKRQDLELLRSLVVGPATDAAAIYSGQYNQAQQRGQTQDASKAAQQQQYLQMLMGLVGMFA
jgi:hypothetical protein